MKPKINFYSSEDFIDYITQTIADQSIKSEIIGQINNFEKDGKIDITDNVLFGKMITDSEKDYLQIRLNNDVFNCFYTRWNEIVNVSIKQIILSDNNKKISREETEEYIFNDFVVNETNTEQMEKIYSNENKLLYQSVLTNKHSYQIIDNYNLDYSEDKADSHGNDITLEKKWYIPDEYSTIIGYNLSKQQFSYNSTIEETYYISSITNYLNGEPIRNRENIKEELFKYFMTGDITIEELKEKNKKNKPKVKVR